MTISAAVAMIRRAPSGTVQVCKGACLTPFVGTETHVCVRHRSPFDDASVSLIILTDCENSRRHHNVARNRIRGDSSSLSELLTSE